MKFTVYPIEDLWTNQRQQISKLVIRHTGIIKKQTVKYMNAIKQKDNRRIKAS